MGQRGTAASQGFTISPKSISTACLLWEAACNLSPLHPTLGEENRLGGMQYGFRAHSLCLAKMTLIKPLAACKSYSYRADN